MKLEDFGLDKETVLEALTDKLANHLEIQEINRATERATEIARERATKIVEERIGKEVDRLISSEFTPIDVWGEPKGKPTTIKDMMKASLEKWWTQPVNKNGEAVPRGSYGVSMPRAQHLVEQVCKEIIDKDMSADLRKMVNELREKVKIAMAATIAEVINKTWK